MQRIRLLLALAMVGLVVWVGWMTYEGRDLGPYREFAAAQGRWVLDNPIFGKEGE